MIATVLAAVLWTAPVSAPPARGQAWLAAQVPGWLEAVEAGDLDTVRMLDATDAEVPYRLVDPASGEESWHEPPVYNWGRTDGGFAADLLNPERRLLDRLRLRLGRGEGVLAVTVSVADGPEAGALLAERVLVGRLQGVDVVEVPLAPTDAGRLQVRGETVLAGWTVEGFAVHARGAVAARRHGAQPLALGEGVAEDGWQAWDLTPEGGTARFEALEVEVTAPPVFRRRARVLGFDAAAARWRTVGEGTLARVPVAGGRDGLEVSRVALEPSAFARWRLLVARGDERPLVLARAWAQPAPRHLVFPAGGWEPPLRLERGAATRSRSLQQGPAVDLGVVAVAEIGARMQSLPQEDGRTAGHGSGRGISDLLFVVAAVLLGLLAWRVASRAAASGS